MVPRPPASEEQHRELHPALRAGAAVVLVAGAALRFWSPPALWLDEALTVNIARLPLSELTDGLRQDGAPPLYYVLLHGWMRLFGTGDVAVRALSGLFGVASLPLAWLAGRRLGGPRVAWAALLLLASSPFAVHFSTEARMYALIILLTLVGYLCVANALERPSKGWLAGVAAVTGLLSLSHYWTFYLLAAVVAVLGRLAWRPGPARDGARRCLVAMGLGALMFVPWLPVFVFQLLHTGTPWTKSPTLAAVVGVIDEFAGGGTAAGSLLGVLFILLLAIGVVGRPGQDRRIELDLSQPSRYAGLALVTFATLALAVLATMVTGGGFAGRYASVVLAPFLLVVAGATAVFADRRVRHGVLATAVALGSVGAAANPVTKRTQAPEVARIIQRLGSPGDVVAYCPDQMGPSVSRLLPARFQQVTFPDLAPPFRVNWVDYLRRNRAGDPASFSRALLDRAGPDGDVFLVWSSRYRGPAHRCQTVAKTLEESRRAVIRVYRDSDSFERMTLTHFMPG